MRWLAFVFFLRIVVCCRAKKFCLWGKKYFNREHRKVLNHFRYIANSDSFFLESLITTRECCQKNLLKPGVFGLKLFNTWKCFYKNRRTLLKTALGYFYIRFTRRGNVGKTYIKIAQS